MDDKKYNLNFRFLLLAEYDVSFELYWNTFFYVVIPL